MSKSVSALAERIHLCAGTSAIDRITLGLDWECPLDAEFLAELSSSLRDQITLPRCIEFRATEDAADQQPDASSLDRVPELVKIVWDNGDSKERPDSDKTLELKLQKNGFYFQVSSASHISWADTKTKYLSYAKPVIEKLFDSQTITEVGMQIVDSIEFDPDLNYSELLNFECDLIPRSVFSQKGYWRYEHSFFESLNSTTVVKVNFHILISPVHENLNKLVIICLHNFLFSKPRKIMYGELFKDYESLFLKNRSLVSSLLSQDLSSLINEDSRGES